MATKHPKPIEYDISEQGCFECVSHAFDQQNYPLVKRNGRMNRISRYIYEACFGYIPLGNVVRHKCDNPKCINPEHLELGTHKQNMNDMVSRNRSAKGSHNGSSRLSEADVRKIKNMRSEGKTYKRLSNEFGVSITSIHLICSGKKWKHVI